MTFFSFFFFKYRLPSSACDPPLQLDLAVAPQSETPITGTPLVTWNGLIVLRYAVNPGLSGALLDVIVDLDLPPEFVQIVRVSPAAQWSPTECRLRWNIGKLDPGSSGCLRAVVGAKLGTLAARAEDALCSGTQAKVVFTGWPGKAMSGVRFEVSLPEEQQEIEYHGGKIVTFGEVTVRPG